jgi:hypothetical protein
MAPSASRKTASAALRVERRGGAPAITGDRLPAARSEINPHLDRGRVARLGRPGLADWRGFQAGDLITLPGFDGEEMEASIALRTEDAGWLRLGGELKNAEGTFAMNTNFDTISGFILLPALDLAYEITTDPSGEVLMAERPLEALMCPKYRVSPGSEAELAGTSATGTTIAQGAAIPSINTRPGAKGVIYVDFDGAQVTDPAWNGGKLISALPSNFTTEQVELIVRSVAEDYAPFDVTITTNLADYTAAAAGRRMWVIVTPTSTAAPGSGGVAYVNSWSGSGKNFSSTIPCWVFNAGVKSATDTISHEVGHFRPWPRRYNDRQHLLRGARRRFKHAHKLGPDHGGALLKKCHTVEQKRVRERQQQRGRFIRDFTRSERRRIPRRCTDWNRDQRCEPLAAHQHWDL